MVNLYNGILFSNYKEWTIDIGHNMDESQNIHVGWNKPDQKEGSCMISFI